MSGDLKWHRIFNVGKALVLIGLFLAILVAYWGLYFGFGWLIVGVIILGAILAAVGTVLLIISGRHFREYVSGRGVSL